MSRFYDGTKLLSLKDINGNRPEIYISTSNRSAGKTTYFNRWFVKRFLEHDEKFILIYRFNYELSDVAEKFFRDIGAMFFPEHEMTAVSRNKNVYVELFLDEISCGYAIAINNSDQIKKLSHLFSDAQRMLFDEFQSETGHYCANEVEKMISIHTSIARGSGEQVRYLPIYMIGNFVSVLNPYYLALGIAHRLQLNTNYLRGDGFVLEQGFYKEVADKQKNSAFNRAFSGSKYTRFAAEKIYLNDNNVFIEKMNGANQYLATIQRGGKRYSIRKYTDTGFIYCSNSYDETYPFVFCTDPADHDENSRLISKNDYVIAMIRAAFENGCLRFQDLTCKEVIYNLLNYALY